MPDAAPIITAINLVKRYGTTTAVDRVSFAVQSGECFGLLGPNGAGKSTTIRMITCSSPLTAGSLTVAGLRAGFDDDRIKARLGVVPQDNNLDEDLSVLDNLLVYASYFDIPGRLARPRALELLELFQLADRAAARTSALSGGMQRRLIIARALMNQPDVVVLDEPTTGLDPQARHLLWQQLRALRQRGVTMVLTTHYMDEAAQLCDRLVVINQGKIIAEGAPDALIRQYAGAAVLEFRDGTVTAEQVTSRIGSAGLTIETSGDMLFVYSTNGHDLGHHAGDFDNAVFRPATLEDVFLRLTGRGLQED